MENCIFCKIIEGEIASYKISETKNTFTVLDAFPMAKGHVLILSKKHTENLHELDSHYLSEMMDEVKRVAMKMVITIGLKDYNMLVNNGGDAGQSIPHVHFHIIPRRQGDRVIQFQHGNKQTDEYYLNLIKKLT